jgi:hypothetical protein
MSEYQYYEFQAIDRPLSKEQMAELRAISTRAEITSTRFTNFYSYGSFKGDEIEMLERYFDAHVYVANWGSHVLIFGMPARAVSLKALEAYQAEGGFAVQARRERVIVTFESQDEDGGGWVEEDEGEGWMASLVSLRADLLGGDLRAAYLGWLRGVQAGVMLDDDEDDEWADDDDATDELRDAGLEPPVPPGLGSLTGPLESLVVFLDLAADLVAVAAERSSPLSAVGSSAGALKSWIGGLAAAEKDGFLVRLMQGDAQLQPELLRRFRALTAPRAQAATTERRTVRELLDAAAARTAERKRVEAEAAAKERARRVKEAAREREAYLTSMIGQEGSLWHRAEVLVGTKKPNDYDRAVKILVDLRDLAIREGEAADFDTRVLELRLRHSSKPSFIQRLDKARLSGQSGPLL